MKKLIIAIFATIVASVVGYLWFSNYKDFKPIESIALLEKIPVEEGKLIQKINKNQIQFFQNSKVWGKTSFDDLRFELHYRAKVRPTTLIIGKDSPNGTKFLALFSEGYVHLPLKFANDFGGFDEFGDINKDYYAQVAEHDFDNDGIPEIIVAIGDGLIDLAVNVIKYHAPLSPNDAGRGENWELVGSFTGQEKAIIDGNKIYLPYGSQGLYTEYFLIKNKFIQTN